MEKQANAGMMFNLLLVVVGAALLLVPQLSDGGTLPSSYLAGTKQLTSSHTISLVGLLPPK